MWALFSPAQQQKIRQYLREGRVFLQENQNGILTSLVRGSAGAMYKVHLHEGDANLNRAACTCPAAICCVHMGASFLSWQERQATAERSPLDAPAGAVIDLTPDSDRSSNSKVDRELDALLETEFAALLATAVPHPVKAEHNPMPPGKERWRAGFMFCGGRDADGLVRPVLIYLKKDGTPGRVREWSDRHLTETPDPDTAVWLEMMLRRGSMDLEDMLLLEGAKGIPALPRLVGESGAVLELCQVENLAMQIIPEFDRWNPHTVQHRASMSVTLAHSGRTVYAMAAHRGFRSWFFACEDNVLAILQPEARLQALLERTSRWAIHADLGEVRALQATLLRFPLSGFSLNVQGEQIKKLKLRGEVCLMIEEHGGIGRRGGSLVQLEMDWKDSEGLAPDTLRYDFAGFRSMQLDSASGTAWILEHDLAWQSEVYDWIFHQLEPCLHASDKKQYKPIDISRFLRTERSYYGFRAIPPLGEDALQDELDQSGSFRLILSPLDFLAEHGQALMDKSILLRIGRNGKLVSRGKVAIQIDRGMDWLDIEASMEGIPHGKPGARARQASRKWLASIEPGRKAQLLELQEVLQRGVAKTEQGYVLISPDDAEKLQRLLKTGLDLGAANRIALANIGQLAALHGPDTSHIKEIQTARDLLDKLANLDSTELLPTPAGCTAQLRGYQRRGFSWLVAMHSARLGACLADDMGLGKTLQALCCIQELHQRFQAAGISNIRVLIVAPVSTLGNWESETRKFCPELSVYRHQGAERVSTTSGTGLAGSYHIAVVSYATLRLDQAAFSSIHWDIMLVDEAQTIKNPESATYKAVDAIPADWRVSLTGTPVENTVMDMWAHMNFINNGMLGSVKRFRSRFAAAIEERRDDAALQGLRKAIAPFILRRKKEDVATDLPPKEEIVLFCDMGSEQRRVYEDVKDSYRLKVETAIKNQGRERSAMTILEALLRLRQCCLFPGIIRPEWATVPSAKLEILQELFEELQAEAHKALVFSQFVEVLSRLSANADQLKLRYEYLDGQSKQRQESIARFQSDPDCNLFFLSLKAGGVGINLTAADYVILFDPWWNPAVESQAIDRAHRIGQERPVIVYRIIVRDSVEEKILQLQAKKRSLIDSLQDNDASLLAGLDTEELLGLLG